MTQDPARVGRLVGLALVFAFLVWANVVTPLWADDYCRLTATGFVQPLALAWRDYFHWTGRFFVTALTYLALEVGRTWSMLPFDVLNAAVFAALIVNVLALARWAAGVPDRPGQTFWSGAAEIVSVFLLLWWLPREIGEVALWKTGSIGYLWAVAGELSVLRLALSPAWGSRLWAAALAFVIATFLEPLSFLISGVLLAACALHRRLGFAAPVWLTAAHVAGTFFLLAAPGNFVRASIMAPSALPDRMMGLLANVGSLFDPIWVFAIAAVALSRTPLTKGANVRPWRLRDLAGPWGWVFLVLAGLSMGLLLGVPRSAMAARVSFPASVFLICFFTAAFVRRPLSPARNGLIGLTLLVLAVTHMAVVVPGLQQLARIDAAWAADPQWQLGPDADVTLPLARVRGRLVYARKHLFFEGVTPDPAAFINLCYAAAMHVRTVTGRATGAAIPQ